jgi:hypothetical protein
MQVKTPRVSSSHQNEEKIHINICPEMSGFWFNLRITFNNKYLKVCNILLTTDSTFKIHVPTPITVEFLLFIKSQFTTVAHSILPLNQCSHGHVCLLTVASFQKSRGGCEWLHRRKQCVDEVSLHLQLELSTLGFVSVATGRTLQEWGQHTVGLWLGNCLQSYIGMSFFPCLGVGNSLLKFVQSF